MQFNDKKIPQKEGFTDIFRDIEYQAKRPPGGDRHIGNFFRSLLSTGEIRSKIKYLIGEVCRERTKIENPTTYAHLSILLFRAFQYLKLYGSGRYENIHYIDSLKSVDDWRDMVMEILITRKQELIDLLVHRRVVSNIPARYAGIAAVLNLLYPGKKISVIDLGCSSHQGVRKIMQVSIGKSQFVPIKDHTPQKRVLKFMNEPIILEKGVGVDQNDFSVNIDIEWLLACSHYPRQLRDIPFLRERLEKLRSTPNTPFIRADLRNLDLYFKKGEFTVAIFSSVLYQMTPPERREVFMEAYRLVRDDGVVLIQENAEKYRNDLLITEDIGKPYSYALFAIGPRTKGKVWEIFRYLDNRCSEVKSGIDFNYLVRS